MVEHRKAYQMLKIRYFSTSGKIFALFEFDGKNISQKSWYRAMFTPV